MRSLSVFLLTFTSQADFQAAVDRLSVVAEAGALSVEGDGANKARWSIFALFLSHVSPWRGCRGP